MPISPPIRGCGSTPRCTRRCGARASSFRPAPCADYNGEPLLAKLDGARTLFIDGQYDEARPVTLAAFAQRVAGAEFAVVPGAGHSFISDRPEEALGILRPWLRKQDRA